VPVFVSFLFPFQFLLSTLDGCSLLLRLLLLLLLSVVLRFLFLLLLLFVQFFLRLFELVV
jgi:hypothetical protein